LNNITEDFFILTGVDGGVQYLASEKLKNAIEALDCTGIEFMPSNLKLAEWLHGGIREEVMVKSNLNNWMMLKTSRLLKSKQCVKAIS